MTFYIHVPIHNIYYRSLTRWILYVSFHNRCIATSGGNPWQWLYHSTGGTWTESCLSLRSFQHKDFLCSSVWNAAPSSTGSCIYLHAINLIIIFCIHLLSIPVFSVMNNGILFPCCVHKKKLHFGPFHLGIWCDLLTECSRSLVHFYIPTRYMIMDKPSLTTGIWLSLRYNLWFTKKW